MRRSAALNTLRRDLLDIVSEALARVHAGRLVTRALDAEPALVIRLDPVWVVAVGKASVPMASALAATRGMRIAGGLIIGPGDRAETPPGLTYAPASHPVPDAASEAAARRALAIAGEARRQGGGLVVLLSGGASALMTLPAPGLGLADKARTTALLLAAGAPIEDLNSVRKHLSAIKGGRLAAAAGACVTLAISDVVGPPPDDPSAIGSGPTAADGTTFADALAAIDRAGVRDEVPQAVLELLERGSRGEVEETIKPGDPRLAGAVYRLIGSRADALAGAREAAEARGYATLTIDEPVVGAARAAGARLAEMAARWLPETRRPFCLLAAGETTVRVRGAGKGGRNQELALAAALAGLPDAACAMASAGTDGVDGPTDAAGAVVDSTTLDRAARAGLGDPARYLDANDSYRFFEPLGDLIKTGPTGTNVGDLQVVLVA